MWLDARQLRGLIADPKSRLGVIVCHYGRSIVRDLYWTGVVLLESEELSDGHLLRKCRAAALV